MKLKDKKNTKFRLDNFVLDDTLSESEEVTSGSEYTPVNKLSDSDTSDSNISKLSARSKRKRKSSFPQHDLPSTSESVHQDSDSVSSKSSFTLPSKTKRKRRRLVSQNNLEKSSPSSVENSSSTSSESDLNLPYNKKQKISSTAENDLKDNSNETCVGSSRKKKKNQNRKMRTTDSDTNNVKNSTSEYKNDKRKKKSSTVTIQKLQLSSANSSLELSINLNSVGPVLQNKKNEVLPSSEKGSKKNTCFYCIRKRQKTNNNEIKIHFAKLVEHYESAHKDEDLIIELNQIPKVKLVKNDKKSFEKRKKRQDILTHLQNEANKLNNLHCENVSQFVVTRRPQVNSGNTVGNYGECYKCHKQLSLTSIHKHVNKCTGLSFKHNRIVCSNSRATTGAYHEIASEEAIKIISVIRDGDILDEIRYDRAIFIWLNAEASKFETAKHNHNRIRANLRRLGRLKYEMKLLNENVTELSDIHEDHYEDLISAIKIMGNPDPVTKLMKAPSTANDMSFLIKSVANIYYVMLGASQKKKRDEIDAFLKKITTLWHSSIGNTIAETQASNRRNKSVKLPSEDDLILLRSYLENQMLTAYKSLKIKYSDEEYKKLRNSLVSYLHVTNCRRAGEIEKLTISDLNRVEIKNEHCRIEVRGKRSKPVPIVFKKNVHNYLQLLINNRRKAKIFKQNPYVFAEIHNISSNYTFVKACKLMTGFADSCGASNSDTLRGTLFRKHLATTGMEKGLNDQEIQKLCSYMGHTPGVHQNNYRMSLFERDIGVSELLSEAQINSKSNKRTSVTEKSNVLTFSEQDDGSIGPALNYDNRVNEHEDESLGDDGKRSLDVDENESTEDNSINNTSFSEPSKSHRKLPWSKDSINALLARFPDALNTQMKVPTASEIRAFLSTTTDTILKLRTEPQVRIWIHSERKRSANKNDISQRNTIPNFIYAKFNQYIQARKVPSAKTCSKFLAKSPSKFNITISNVQHWVEMAIKRKSL